ncbi:hypothetical protein NBO_27g0016 [Nosema bombycis CQ1]|uniref:Uncharacterized protein n=1 Tax=Nosema bombycis (strain CQ1 / CVCC 102059) TaxID=578461 RepID=R0M930_NOSB1|nr:hypothetical protein NBO_27g0016 [Nosema bombycis CQ1]|eukprot:EOB14459.1 hypothetical protein NBO_27g0016 [Nosema bombycis CQ1]
MEDYDLETKGYYLRLNSCDDSPSQKFKLVDMPKTDQGKTPLAPLPNESDGNSQDNVNDACSNVNMSNKLPASIPNTASGKSRNSISDPCSNVNTAKATSAPNSTTANGNSQNTIADPCSTVNIAKATSAQNLNTANCISQNNSPIISTNETMPNIVFIPVTFEPNSIPFLTEGSQFGNNITPFTFDANRSKAPTSFNSVYKFRRPAQPGNGSNNHLQWTGLFRRYY